MSIALNIALILLLLLTLYQDRKQRSVHIAVFIALAFVSTYLFVLSDFSWNQVLMNIVFTIVVISILALYISLKEGRVVNIFKTHFGIGDLVFLIAITPLFANQNFILFFITGIAFSALTHVLMSQLKRGGETIPLAGYMSVYLVFIKVADILLLKDIFYSQLF